MVDNQEQIEFWNGEAGDNWVAEQQQMDAMLAPISASLLSQANGQAGELALDVGCGCGDTSLALAELGLKVSGVDISQPMLAHARSRKNARHDLDFVLGDASTMSFAHSFDLILSRFGVMFFSDPQAAFNNLQGALRQGGRLCFICWQAPSLNEWISVPMQVVKPLMLANQEPTEAPDPEAPGPFAFANPDRLRNILDKAGFSDIVISAQSHSMGIGTDAEAAARFCTRMGPVSAQLKEQSEETIKQIHEALQTALEPFATATGVKLNTATWLVSAQKA
ncbi:MAG: class I SAM-dependent methyltransferase [Pseudomonadales bacterium]